ncbi:MAG: beta-lactamase family protein [Clostridia bacterium]|nr:beta-lactamase family protein [Clostridia bacterium]
MTPRENLSSTILDITRRYQAAGYFPSACVRVFNARETLAAVCVGEAEEGSLFDVASLTKIATATQILLLIQAGKLRLQDQLKDHFPEIAGDEALNKRMGSVTLYQLLTHTSTLPDWYPFYSRVGEDFFTALTYALAHTAPTVGMVYSDLNFMLLGKLLEKIQGKPLAQCLRMDLTCPLELGNMLYHPGGGQPIVPSCYGNEIEMEMCRERGISFDGFRPVGVPVTGTVNDGNSHYYFRDEAGHAGIFADALAYQRLCQFYMNTDDSLLLEAQREQAAAPGRGIGFQTGVSYPYGCGHTGFTGTSIYFSREKQIGVVAFTNRLFYPHPNGNATGDFRRVLHEAALALAGKN